MKICPKCTKQNYDDAKFCVNCGENLEAVGVSEDSEASVTEKTETKEQHAPVETSPDAKAAKPKKNIPPVALKAGIAGVVLIILIVMICKFAGCGKTKIDLNDFVSISVDGTDTVGTAYYSFDSNALFIKLAEAIGVKDADSVDPYYIMNSIVNKSSREKLANLYEVIYGVFAGELDKTSDLSNGDKIVFEWSINEDQLKKIEKEFKVRFSYEKITKDVEDLDEIKDCDPFANIEVKFYGYEPSGRAEIQNNHDNDSYDEPYFEYELDKEEGLSNGDTVVVTIPDAVDDEQAFKEDCILRWGVEPSATSKEYTVEGLEKTEEYDPFEQLSVSFSGTSPNAQINMDASRVEVEDLEFTADKTENLKIGDTVTVTVSSYYGEDLDTLLAQEGKTLAAVSKEYTVQDIPKCAEKLEDIPQDMIDKMDQNAQDKLNADAAVNWGTEERITDISMIGTYFLTAKENADVYDSWNGEYVYNKLYCVYKISVQAGESPFTYYTFVGYKNVIIMADGSCSLDLSNTLTCDDRVSTQDGYFYYDGYADLDTLKYKTVTANIDNYTYEEKF